MDNANNTNKDTIHIVVKSPYTIQIVKNTNPVELQVHHDVKSDSITVKDVVTDKPDEINVISAVLSTNNVHHDKGDQMMYSNGRVNLVVEYQLIM